MISIPLLAEEERLMEEFAARAAQQVAELWQTRTGTVLEDDERAELVFAIWEAVTPQR